METDLAEMPANADTEAEVETPEVESEEVETESAESATAAAETGKPDSRDRIQERFDKLTREKYEGLSRAERAEYRAQQLEQRLAEIEAAKAPKETVAPSKRPTLEQFNFDQEAYEAALDEYHSSQTESNIRSILERERQQQQRQQAEQDWQRIQGDFIKLKPDYAEKVGSLPPSLMTDELAAEIKDSGNPEIAYYLAENREKLAEIARLPPKAMAREIGRIEAKLEAAKAAKPPVSKAPPPPQKVDSVESGNAVSTTDPDSDKLSDDEWVKAERKRVARMRGRK